MSSLQDFWTVFVMISFLVFKTHVGQEPGKLQKVECEESIYLKDKMYFPIKQPVDYL